jgi:hypothetical protein
VGALAATGLFLVLNATPASAAPPAPTLSAPANGQHIVNLYGSNFRWSRMPAPDNETFWADYRVEIDEDCSFASPTVVIVDEPGDSFDLLGPAKRAYCWRVAAIDLIGIYSGGERTVGPFSDAWTVHVSQQLFAQAVASGSGELSDGQMSVACSSGTFQLEQFGGQVPSASVLVSGYAEGATCTIGYQPPAGWVRPPDCTVPLPSPELPPGDVIWCRFDVERSNTPPDAVDDVRPPIGPTVEVLANDSDPDGDQLTVTDYTQPVRGSVSCTPDGICTVDIGGNGDDPCGNPPGPGAYDFQYTVSDGRGGSDTATAFPRPIVACADPPEATFVVEKDFRPDAGSGVGVGLTCTSGSVSPLSATASEGVPAEFTIVGAEPGATCTAVEIGWPSQYEPDESDCAAVGIADDQTSRCTLVNTVIDATFSVYKDFVPDSAAGVEVSLACSSGSVSPATVTASEASAAVFTVSGYQPGATTCTATETVPAGYSADVTDCQAVLLSVASCTIVNTRDEVAHRLTVTRKGAGAGLVTSAPAGIDCGSTCAASFTTGTQVTLTATPAPGSVFAGWSGACSGTSPICTTTVSQARTVGARFNPVRSYRLTVTRRGPGAGTVASSPSGIACGTTCLATFASGTVVTLTASASPGSTFAGWTGACSGSALTCTVTMSQARTVSARFTRG